MAIEQVGIGGGAGILTGIISSWAVVRAQISKALERKVDKEVFEEFRKGNDVQLHDIKESLGKMSDKLIEIHRDMPKRDNDNMSHRGR